MNIKNKNKTLLKYYNVKIVQHLIAKGACRSLSFGVGIVTEGVASQQNYSKLIARFYIAKFRKSTSSPSCPLYNLCLRLVQYRNAQYKQNSPSRLEYRSSRAT